MKKFKNIAIAVIAMITLVTLVGCGNENNKEKKYSTESIKNIEFNEENIPVVTMVVEYNNQDDQKEEGTIKMKLYPQNAPVTVCNFVNLVKNGFYDGLTFHRIIDNFMIQGGDPNGTGAGGAKVSDIDKDVKASSKDDFNYSIKGEFTINNVENNTKFEAGTLAMARSDYSAMGLAEDGYNSACSQFFIVNTSDEQTCNHLQGQYAAFGKVIEGYDVVEKISKTKVTNNGREQSTPVSAPVIKKVTVDTKEIDYPIPELINADEVMVKVQKKYNELMRAYSNN